ncbi:prephenate dehydrogenase [Candidatus Xianfuyuplasma coldseepsis]|uniref:Prephenate dehydrogenase n=1 Tax=Candidatus Xianfuyuplasma coldseepsis TaxID=2782163 RepID=A0A7L7KQ58_9MOLU|nr:prephenate dehydrogenase [Xianfuyuplasma coldseepsis]QMS84930.1 prephenate dehydrogenase [Xianfuyuplasma coldseepsis]
MKIGIVGLGLIGGTYAKALKRYPYTIVGMDIDESVIHYALQNNIIDIGTTNPSDVLGDLDVVFLCLYPKAAVSFIQKHITSFKRDAIISDVVGVKRFLIDRLDVYQNDDVEFVFAHPIAGREKVGIKYSDEAIFHDANFVITPTKHNTLEALNLIETLAKQMGFKNVSRIADYEHDDIIAYTSQLTHAIAISLVNSDTDKYDTGLFIGDSYKDLTRIAMINESLWSELFLNNKDFLLRRIDAFEKQLDLLKDALANKDQAKLEELMRQSTKKRGDIK